MATNDLPETPFPADWLSVHADRAPDSPAIADPSARLSYGELATRVNALAGQLAAAGIEPGVRALVALPNLPATVVAGLALNALGATSVEANREWSAEVLGNIVKRSGVRQAFVWARDARRLATVLQDHGLERIWVVHRGARSVAVEGALAGTPTTLLLEDGRVDPGVALAPLRSMPDLSPDWPALVLFTSGSTGVPHGVVQTFRNVDANTRSIVTYLGLTAQDRALLALPLYYCYGRSVLQTHLFVGASVFLEGRMAFPRTVLETIAAEGCSGFAGVPLSFEIFRRQVDVSAIEFPRLRYLTQAGGAMAPETIAWARAVFRPARLYVMYGQTEATARLSYLPPERAEDKEGSIGIPIPGVELQVVDAQGRELPPGEIGELVARGANVTSGYLDEPDETNSILHDDWLWTGDLAMRDPDGFFYHRGRVKDILKIGGHRVSPIEIEQVIARHADVAEAAVVSVANELMGEAPHAYVVPRPGTSPTEADLLRYCRERMPAHIVPVGFTLVPALPRSESGKLLRAELAAQHTAG